MEALTPSQFQIMLVAWDLAEQAGAFGAWDVTHLAGERYGYRGHQAVVRLLKLLVDKCYLRYDPEAGKRGGLYDVPIDAETATAAYVDHFIETLGHDPRILAIAAIRLRERIDSATLAATAV